MIMKCLSHRSACSPSLCRCRSCTRSISPAETRRRRDAKLPHCSLFRLTQLDHTSVSIKDTKVRRLASALARATPLIKLSNTHQINPLSRRTRALALPSAVCNQRDREANPGGTWRAVRVIRHTQNRTSTGTHMDMNAARTDIYT